MFKKLSHKVQMAALAVPALAQRELNLSPNGEFEGLTNITPASLVSGAISLVMLIVALVFFFMLVWGGLKWVMSGGDQKNVEAARNQITNALIGLAIVFAAWAIVKLIELVFGINILNLTIPSVQTGA